MRCCGRVVDVGAGVCTGMLCAYTDCGYSDWEASRATRRGNARKAQLRATRRGNARKAQLAARAPASLTPISLTPLPQ
jgi:hypothetical protein